jgi:hypothetical protein
MHYIKKTLFSLLFALVLTFPSTAVKVQMKSANEIHDIISVIPGVKDSLPFTKLTDKLANRNLEAIEFYNIVYDGYKLYADAITELLQVSHVARAGILSQIILVIQQILRGEDAAIAELKKAGILK